MIQAENLLRGLPSPSGPETLEILARGAACRVERIVSHGHATPEGEWYDQERAEWVMVVAGAARLRFETRPDLIEMKVGDWINIPAHARHRVEWTTPDEPTIWLAVHFTASTEDDG